MADLLVQERGESPMRVPFSQRRRVRGINRTAEPRFARFNFALINGVQN